MLQPTLFPAPVAATQIDTRPTRAANYNNRKGTDWSISPISSEIETSHM